MAYQLIKPTDDTAHITPREKGVGALKNIGKGAESIAHQQLSAAAEVPAQILGYPGNLFNFINTIAAKPITEFILDKPGLEYKETYLGKVFPTSSEVRQSFEQAMPYLKPSNEYEKFTNNLYGTATQFLLPGGQAQVGLTRAHPAIRSLIKSLGVEIAGTGTEKLTGSKEKGDIARMGSMFLLGMADRPGANRYLGEIYNRATNALQQAGNPTFDAARITQRLTNLRTRLSQGTRAPSEQAVINEIDRILEHVQQGRMPVQNAWSSLRSLNENRLAAQRSIAGRTNRLRARNLFNEVGSALHDELNNYGRINPDFGTPFQEAQTGTRTLHQSNLIQQTVENLTGFEVNHPGIMHLFGSGIGATAAAAKHSVVTAPNIIGLAAYQASKILFRMARSPALRRYYTNAIRAGIQENIPQMAKEIQKMDDVLTKEDKKNPPLKLVKKTKPPQ